MSRYKSSYTITSNILSIIMK